MDRRRRPGREPFSAAVNRRHPADHAADHAADDPPTTRRRRAAAPAGSPTPPNSWNNGFTANVTVTNTGCSPINGWTLAFTFPAASR